MSATTDIYITPSTSLVLIKSLSTLTNIYLRAYDTPFTVTIRDTTGLSSIQEQPVRISTIESARFVDGTSFYPLQEPYGLVNLSLRNSTVWHINHTSGQPTATAAATVGVLQVSSLYVGLFSTGKAIISSLFVDSFQTPNPITITSPLVLTNLSAPGYVLFEDNLTVYQSVRLNGLTVRGSTFLTSSFFVEDLQPLSSLVVGISSIGIGGSAFIREALIVKSTLHLQSTVQVATLQITKSTTQTANTVFDTVRLAGLLSTLGNLTAAKTTFVGGDLQIAQEVSTIGGWFSTIGLYVGGSALVQGHLSTVSTAAFASSLQGLSTLFVSEPLVVESQFGGAGSFYASTVSTVGFSTLGSLSTVRLSLPSSVFVTGNVSTAFFQSYFFMSIGGNLETPATISSLLQTNIKGDISVLGDSILSSAHTSSSLGIGDAGSVMESTFTSFITVRGDETVGSRVEVKGFTDIQQNLTVRSTAFVFGNLKSLGAVEISSFFVESYLLSNLVISSLFQASSFHGSSISTAFTRVSSLQPDVYIVSSIYASTVQSVFAKADTLRINTLETGSLFTGSDFLLSEESNPLFVLGTKSQFVRGISSLDVQADTIEADFIQASLIGTASYLSNVPFRFGNLSTLDVTVSSVNTLFFFTSSFVTSTFVNTRNATVQSSIITPTLAFESQGFEFRYDKNQFLNINPKLMAINRNLFFDRDTNRIGLFLSTPSFDLDVSGQVFASNIVYSSINPLFFSTQQAVVFSTVIVSSSYVLDSLQYGEQGLQIFSKNIFTGDTYATLNTTVSSSSNLFGIFDCIEQSTILLNTGVHVYRNQQVAINGYIPYTGEFLPPSHSLDIHDTLRTENAYLSTVHLFQSLQTNSILSPQLYINQRPIGIRNTVSSSIEKLCINDIVTIQTDYQTSDRRVGIHTLNPVCTLDIRGNASFSSVLVFGSFRSDTVAMSCQEF